MRKTVGIILAVMVVFLFSITIPVNGAAIDARIIPADADWALHFDVNKFKSTTFHDLLEQMGSKKYAYAKKYVAALYKLNLDKDIDSITIFGSATEKQQTVAAWRGKFDEKHIVSMLEISGHHKISPYGKTNIHKWHNDFYGAFYREYALLGFSEEAIKHTLDVLSGKKESGARKEIYSIFGEMPDDAFVKAYAYNLSGMAKGGFGASSILGNAKMAFFIAQEHSDILKLKLKLSTHSTDSAQNIERIVQGLLAMVKMQAETHTSQQKNSKTWYNEKLLEGIDVRVDGKVVTLQLNIASSDLANLLLQGPKRIRVNMK